MIMGLWVYQEAVTVQGRNQCSEHTAQVSGPPSCPALPLESQFLRIQGSRTRRWSLAGNSSW